MRVEVTEADIRGGTRFACRYCPIALAVGRLFPGETVSVAGGARTAAVYADSGDANPRKLFGLPIVAVLFIDDFDGGQNVAPFSFEMEEVQPLLRLPEEDEPSRCNCNPADNTGGGHSGTCPEFEPECTCYELTGGHQPVGYFNRRPVR